MSSGSETRKRQQIVRVRCTADEAAQLAAVARSQGKTISSCVRDTMIAGARPAPKPRRRTPAADERELARVLGQLGKWGSNLNQLAHQANMDEPVKPYQFEELADQVRAASRAVLEALGRGHQG
jgi:hypothetical protein